MSRKIIWQLISTSYANKFFRVYLKIIQSAVDTFSCKQNNIYEKTH